jgi:hypothetical protein
MDTIQSYFQPGMEYLKNPYVIGTIAIMSVIYGSYMARQLPPNIAVWFDNPLFRVLFIAMILIVRQVSPAVAILLALGLIISIQTLNRYKIFTMANEVSQIAADQADRQVSLKSQTHSNSNPKNQEDGIISQPKESHPPMQGTPEEQNQINQELALALREGFEAPIAHEFTFETNPRVENPDDPKHPGWTQSLSQWQTSGNYAVNE